MSSRPQKSSAILNMGWFIGIGIEIGIEIARIDDEVDSDSDSDSDFDALHEVAVDKLRIAEKSYNLMEIDKMARKDKRRTPGSRAGITIRIRIRKDVEFWDWMEGMGMFVKG